MITTLFIWILFSVSEAYEDSQYTVIYDHKPTVYPRILAALGITFLWSAWHGLGLMDAAKFLFILVTTFWFVFELSGNIARGHYFYYIGNTSRIDKLLKKHEWPVFWFRLWLVALAFALYYYHQLLNY